MLGHERGPLAQVEAQLEAVQPLHMCFHTACKATQARPCYLAHARMRAHASHASTRMRAQLNTPRTPTPAPLQAKSKQDTEKAIRKAVQLVQDIASLRSSLGLDRLWQDNAFLARWSSVVWWAKAGPAWCICVDAQQVRGPGRGSIWHPHVFKQGGGRACCITWVCSPGLQDSRGGLRRAP